MADIDFVFESDTSDPIPELDISQTRALCDKLGNILIAVATGGPEIKTVNRNYQVGIRVLKRNTRRFGVECPYSWDDLWEWYGDYREKTAQYWERRKWIGDARKAALDALDALEVADGLVDPSDGEVLPGWESLEARLSSMRDRYAQASELDDYQDVGRRCREILIDLGKLIADPALVPEGEDPPKNGDAKKWLELYVAQYLPGKSKAELRKLVRDAWDACQKVTHGDVERVDALIAAQATILVLRTCHVLHDSAMAETTDDTAVDF